MKKRQPPRRKPRPRSRPVDDKTVLFEPEDIVQACRIFYEVEANQAVTYGPVTLAAMRRVMLFSLQVAALNLDVK